MDTALRDQLQSLLNGNYAIERELGRGGMGTVFLARDLALERPVAIKVLAPELAAQPVLRERFLRETRTAAAFSHPNIVPVHAVEQHDEMLLFVMGYVDGETLAERVKRGGPLSAAETVRLLQEVAWALSYAHGRGVIHRDVKPDNILIERGTGRALVTDFGIARSTAATGLTMVGEVVGTPQYMSPEQAAGEQVDGRSDLYSLGVVAFLALTGRLPFEAASTPALLAMHLTQPAPRVADLRPDLPAALSDAVDRLLAKNPADRFPSGDALVTALESVRATHREVPAPLRLFLQRAELTTRSALVIALLIPVLTSRLQHLDALVFPVFMLAIIAGLLRSVVAGARELARLGIRYDDFRAALGTIAEERREARAALRASPASKRRARRTVWMRAAAAAAGVALVAFAFTTMRLPALPGVSRYRVSLPGVVMIVAGEILVALAFVATMTDPARRPPLERLQRALWCGWPGRVMFRWAARGLSRPARGQADGATSAVSATGSPRLVFDNLSRTLRGEMADVPTALARVEAQLEALHSRGAELDAALGEAQQATPPAGSSPLATRREQLLDDLSSARRDVARREAELLAARENVRLQLLRVRTGIASSADVRSEVAAALALLDGRPPLAGAPATAR